METPWSTTIIDRLPIDASDKLMLRFWIWLDRLFWSSVGMLATCLLAWLA
jgi:hypothetical protein